MDDDVLEVVLEVREKVLAIAKERDMEPWNVLMWYIGKTMHAASNGDQVQGYQVAHDAGTAMGEHFRAEAEGRAVDMTPNAQGIQA